MEENKKWTLNEIFNDEEFGNILNEPEQKSIVKTEDDRLIDSFEEINAFFEKNGREPDANNMSEYSLMARLKNIRENENHKKTLKAFDRFNLLGEVEVETMSIDDVLDDLDALLDEKEGLDLFKYKHIPLESERADTDFVARRKPMKEEEFESYEKMFHKVHKELKEGKRKLIPFHNVDEHLREKHFYLLDGLILYLEEVDFENKNQKLGENTLRRKDGRTRTIFENKTISNMLYRSLSKALYTNGKMITMPDDQENNELYVNAGLISEEDVETGWIYVLKSESEIPEIKSIKNLHKIGFTSTPIEQRISNANNEATYLFSGVKIIAKYQVYNRNAKSLENLLDRFFAEVCLNVDVFDDKGQRYSPREWFNVPFNEIDKAISLIINEEIVEYRYDKKLEMVVRK